MRWIQPRPHTTRPSLKNPTGARLKTMPACVREPRPRTGRVVYSVRGFLGQPRKELPLEFLGPRFVRPSTGLTVLVRDLDTLAIYIPSFQSTLIAMFKLSLLPLLRCFLTSYCLRKIMYLLRIACLNLLSSMFVLEVFPLVWPNSIFQK